MNGRKHPCSRHRSPSSATSSPIRSAARSAIRRSSSSAWPAIRGGAPRTATGSRATRCSSPSTAGAGSSPGWAPRSGRVTPVIVVGNVYTSEYEDRDGNRRSSLEMRATSVGPDLARCIVRIEKPQTGQRHQTMRRSRPPRPAPRRRRGTPTESRTTPGQTGRRCRCPRSGERRPGRLSRRRPRLGWSASITTDRNPSERQHHGMAEFIYTMRKVRKAHGDKVILDDVTLNFLPGAKIGVVGPNGAGKSSVLRIMAGLGQAQQRRRLPGARRHRRHPHAGAAARRGEDRPRERRGGRADQGQARTGSTRSPS